MGVTHLVEEAGLGAAVGELSAALHHAGVLRIEDIHLASARGLGNKVVLFGN